MRWRWTLLVYTLVLAAIVVFDITRRDASWLGNSGVVGLSAVVGWWAGELTGESRPPLVILLGLISLVAILGFVASSEWVLLTSILAGAGAGFLIERSSSHRPQDEGEPPLSVSLSPVSVLDRVERAHSA